MVRTSVGLRAVAVAAQIGGDDGEFFRKPWRDLVPHHMGERIAVEQEERRTRSAFAQIDARARRIELRERKAFEHAIASCRSGV